LPDNSVTEPIGEINWVIPEKKVFVLGDNRGPGESLDSRVLGPISEDDIQGFVILKKK
jgi:type IV secretory pathway protease TraF